MQREWKWGQLKATGLCCGLGLLVAGFAVAQQPAAERAQQRDTQRQLGQQRQAQQQTGQKHFCLSTELIGMTVKGMGDEEVGQVKNLIITQDGQVQYLALSGEADRSAADRGTQDRTPQDRAQQQRTPQTQQAGAQGQLTLVPWELAKFHAGPTKTESFVSVQIEKERLMNAPSFGEEQLTAAQGQAQVIAQVDQFFNIRERRGAARPELNRERDQQDQNRREIPPQREQPQPDAN